MPDIAPDKVAVYIRWSTDDQGEGTTLQTQLERCRCFLGSQGWAFREDLVYIDDGFSGGTLDRPALTRLRADVAAGRVACVVAYKIDRLSRSVVDIVDLVLREWEGRCYIKSTSEDVNTLTPAGKMFFYMLVSFAEYERSVIRERTMGGKIKRAEQGLNPGFRPPFGFTRGPTPGTLAVVEHEAAVVRRVYELFRLGRGPGQIAAELNAGGAARRGAPWSALAVRRMLANPAYAGVLAYGRTMRVGKEQQARQGLPGTVRFARPRYAAVAGAFPAVVAPAVWQEAQALLAARGGGRAGMRACALTPAAPQGAFLLTGLARCRCGARLGGKRVGRHAYYYCTARRRQGRTACAAPHVPAEGVDTLVAERASALLAGFDRSACQDRLRAELARWAHEARADLRRHQAARDGIAGQTRRLERDYRTGDLPAALYARELDALAAEAAAIEQHIREAEAQLASLQAPALSAGDLWPGLTQPQNLWPGIPDSVDLWQNLPHPERQQLLRKLAAAIVLYRDGPETVLEIDWVSPAHQG
ncbi:MAG TPA: recombinase family protein [Symbiobacteriaceae bacterium]